MIDTRNAPGIVELIGLPGCGKSTLTQALGDLGPGFVASERLALKDVRRLPFHLINSPLLAPILYRQLRLRRRLTAQELKDMLYVDTWHRVLSRQAMRTGSVVVADQGPVFKLAMLRGFGPGGIGEAPFEKWWTNAYDRWSRVVRSVVWLEAPDAVLLDRVRARAKRHLLQEAGSPSPEEYFQSYRDGLESVTAKLRATGRTRLIRIDTHTRPPSEIAHELFPLLLERSLGELDVDLPGNA